MVCPECRDNAYIINPPGLDLGHVNMATIYCPICEHVSLYDRDTKAMFPVFEIVQERIKDVCGIGSYTSRW
jgi:hypothetical protein